MTAKCSSCSTTYTLGVSMTGLFTNDPVQKGYCAVHGVYATQLLVTK